MKTISQVAKLTGVSIRTLQYYDEIGLLKPSELTPAGYRLYDEHALQNLQQILFFRELDFPLKDIIKIMQNPDFDRIVAFKKQKELLLLKRNRTDRLIQLLERLEKGEECMSFKEFDLSEYIHALEDFKVNQTDTIIKHWGSIDNFDMFIQKIKDDEENVAKLAIQHFGSIEKYTEETGVKVETMFIAGNWGEYCTKLQTMVGGGDEVDCAILAIEGVSKFLNMGIAESIDDWIEANPDVAKEILDDTSPSFQEVFKDDEGKTYAFPFSFNNPYKKPEIYASPLPILSTTSIFS